MAIRANGLTTVARIKAFLGITVATHDTILEQLINMVSDFVSNYCNRVFQEATYTNEIYDGTGSPDLVLEKAPVSTTGTFTLEERTGKSNWDSIDSENYWIDFTTGIVHSVSGCFSSMPQKYRATYTAGYAFDNFTPGATLESVGIGDLEFACWKLVSKAFNNRKGATDIQDESIGDYSVTFRVSAMTDPVIKEILNHYVRPHRNK